MSNAIHTITPLPVAPPTAAAPTSALELLLLGLRSALLTESALKLFFERHPAATLPDTDATARLLVEEGLLSKFQAELLLLGHPGGLTLGRYRLVDLIGKGGMGRVFLAHDSQLDRRVAVKVLCASANRVDLRGRFLRETRAAAALVHPNVVAAYDSGEQGGALFLVMEYVSGVTLHAKVAREGPLPIPLACNYVRQAAHGLAAVHAAGLIHRDVKPSNLIATDDGKVKLLDLGLARFLEPTHPEDGPLTLMHNLGQILGTPQFLAPEQFARSDHADRRSDIYGLGAVLYYLLTGRFPQPGPTLEQTPLPVISPAAHTRPDLPGELSELLARLLAANPDARPQTGEEVAAALAAFTSAPCLAAIPPRPLPSGRRWRWAAAICTVLALGAGLVFALRPSSTPLPIHDPPPVIPIATTSATEVAPAPRPAPMLRDLGLVGRRDKPLVGVSLSPDGHWAAVADLDGNTVVWDVLGERDPLILAAGSRVVAPTLFADGTRLLFGRSRTSVGVWDLLAGELVEEIEHPEGINAAAANPDGSLNAVGDRTGATTLYDRKQAPQTFRPPGTTTGVAAVAFRPGHETILVGHQFPNRVSAWVYTQTKPVWREAAPAGGMVPGGMVPFPDGRRVAAVGTSRVSILDLHKWEYVRLIPSGDSEIRFGSAAVGPSGKWLVTGGQDGMVRVWDVDSSAELAAVPVHLGKSRIIAGIALSVDGRTAVTACTDGTARLLHLNVPE